MAMTRMYVMNSNNKLYVSVSLTMQDMKRLSATCWQMSGGSSLQETASGLFAAGLQLLPLRAGQQQAAPARTLTVPKA